jgi:hypothetical protein
LTGVTIYGYLKREIVISLQLYHFAFFFPCKLPLLMVELAVFVASYCSLFCIYSGSLKYNHSFVICTSPRCASVALDVMAFFLDGIYIN